MTETIIGRVKEAKFYSITCDEASDALNNEQLPLDMSMMMEISVKIF